MLSPVFGFIFVIVSLGCIHDCSCSAINCDQSFLGQTGVIASHNFPFDYRHNLNCRYSIVLDHHEELSKIVCLTFYRFSLEGSSEYCSFDYLMLDHVKIKYCGHGLWQYGPQPSNPKANAWSRDFCFTVKQKRSFDLTFRSDNSTNAAGFYLKYNVYDGATTDEDDIQASPGQAPCLTGQWTCFNRKCINTNQVCDGRNDCQDGSDESYAHARCGSENVFACDFSSSGVSDGYCEFTHEGWFRTNENHSTVGPQGDHTNGSVGHYVYSDINQGSAYLLSPELTLSLDRTHCLSFWYFMYGSPTQAELHVYVSREQAYSRPEWSRTKAPSNQWIQGQIVIRTQTYLQVIFAAELENSFSGVALDDISLLEGECSGDDISCNFESTTCGWQPTNNITHLHGNLHGDLKWTIHNRLLAPKGPYWDHSSRDGGGYYLYLNYTLMPNNNRGLIVSPGISSHHGNKQCLTFWYHMTGADSNCCQLRVKVQLADGVMIEAIWSQHGDVRNSWEEANVELRYDSPFKLILEGTVSPNSIGEIGVDAIVLSADSCSSHTVSTCETGHFLCGNGECIDAALKCNGISDCLDGSDEGLMAACPTPASSSSAVPTVSTTTRPSGDKDVCPGEFQCYPSVTCVSLWYKCDGFFDCPNHADEVGCTATTHSPSQCTNTQYKCANDECIAASLRCNGREDCRDGSDEGAAAGCSNTSISICMHSEFSCKGGSIQCISQELRCDGTSDCSDGSDEEDRHAQCSGMVSAAPFELGLGAIIGIAVGCVVCIIIVFISCFLKRKRRKPRSPHQEVCMDTQQGIATIGVTGTTDSAVDRHMTMLQAIRQPMQQQQQQQIPQQQTEQVVEPPPYSERSVSENMGYASDGTLRADRSRALPPDEPPPPYDAVLKEHSRSQSMDSLASMHTASPSRSRDNSLALGLLGDTQFAVQHPLMTSSPFNGTVDSRRSIGTDSEHIYEEPATLLRPSTSAHGGMSPQQTYAPQLPDRPPLMPLSHQSPDPDLSMSQKSLYPQPGRIRLGTKSLMRPSPYKAKPAPQQQQQQQQQHHNNQQPRSHLPYESTPNRNQQGFPPGPPHSYQRLQHPQYPQDFQTSPNDAGGRVWHPSGSETLGHRAPYDNRRASQPNRPQSMHFPNSESVLPYSSTNILAAEGSLPTSPPQPQGHIFIPPVSSSSTDPFHPRMDSTESFGGCSTSPLMANSSHDDSRELEVLSPTSV